MTTCTIDTAAAIARLENSGLDSQQAKAIVDIFLEQDAEVVSSDHLEAALNSLFVKIISSQVAVAALLFAALKFFA